MSSNRIPLTRTSPLEQGRRQGNNLQYEADAGRGWRETSHRYESHASNNGGDPRAARYDQASIHNVPEADEDEEAVLYKPSHYQGPSTVFGGARGGGRLSRPSPRRERPPMSSAGYGRQGASAYDCRGGGHGEHSPPNLDSTMSLLEDNGGYSGRMPRDTADLFESYGGGYGGSPPHLKQNQMSGALSTTSKLPYEYAGYDSQGAVFAVGANYGEHSALPSLYNPAYTDKLMDERAGRTRPGPYPGYPQRYIESVEAAMRDCARKFGWPLTYQVDLEVLRGGPAMSSGHRHGGSGGQLLPRFPSYARSNERFDGDIWGQRSVPQGTSFVTIRSRAS